MVDRRTHRGNGSNGVVRLLRNGKALESKSLHIGFTEEAVLVVSFGSAGQPARIVSFEQNPSFS